MRQVDELEPIALGQPLGERGLGRALRGARFGHADVELALGGAVGGRRRFTVHTDSLTPLRVADYRSAFDKLKSGM